MESANTTKPIQSYEDLDVYQRSMALIRPIHDAVRRFPEFEQRDIVQQMRRASKSVPTNIAEGFSKRRSAKEFKAYLAHALGSGNEMLVHLAVAQELGYLSNEEASQLMEGYNVVCRQLNRLMQRWQ